MYRSKLLPLFLLLVIFLAACSGGEDKVTGDITLQGDSAIPDGATITVQIQDTSRQDVAATVIGEQIITGTGEFPVSYEVSYDPDEIVDNNSYTMSARITGSNDELLFINDTAIPVITRDNPTENVEIPVIEVGG